MTLGLLSVLAGCGQGEQRSAPPVVNQERVQEKEQEIWAPRWDYLGGAPGPSVAAASYNPGTLSVFWRASDGSLKHKWYPYAGGWSYEQTLEPAGTLSADPGAVSDGAGRLIVFYRNASGTLSYKKFPCAGDWCASATLSSFSLPANAVPAVSSWAQDRYDVFWRGSAGNIEHVWQAYNGSGWFGVENLGGSLLFGSYPAAVSYQNARIDLFWRNNASPSGLVHKYYPCTGGSCCGAWTCGTSQGLSADIRSSPTVASRGGGTLDVFFRGSPVSNSNLGHQWTTNSGGAWTGVEDLGWLGNIPNAVAWNSNHIDVFSRTSVSGGQVARRTWEYGQPWYPIAPPAGTIVASSAIQATSSEQTSSNYPLWEFGATLTRATPANGCPSPGRGFLSGSNLNLANGSNNMLAVSNLTCSSPPCSYENISTLPNLPAGEAIGLDGQMATTPGGETLLLKLGDAYCPSPNTCSTYTKAMLFRSTDCGDSWLLNYIDPKDFPQTARMKLAGGWGWDQGERISSG